MYSILLSPLQLAILLQVIVNFPEFLDKSSLPVAISSESNKFLPILRYFKHLNSSNFNYFKLKYIYSK